MMAKMVILEVMTLELDLGLSSRSSISLVEDTGKVHLVVSMVGIVVGWDRIWCLSCGSGSSGDHVEFHEASYYLPFLDSIWVWTWNRVLMTRIWNPAEAGSTGDKSAGEDPEFPGLWEAWYTSELIRGQSQFKHMLLSSSVTNDSLTTGLSE